MLKARAKLQKSVLQPGVNIKSAIEDMRVRFDSTVYVLGEGTFGLCVSVDGDLESGCALKLPLTAKRKLADSSDTEFAHEVEVASGFCRIDTDEDIKPYRGLVVKRTSWCFWGITLDVLLLPCTNASTMDTRMSTWSRGI